MSARVALIVALGCAIATWAIGWWSVPIVALAAGAWSRRDCSVTLGTVLGWAALLAADSVAGSFGVVAGTVGAVMKFPGAALVVVTLLFVSILGWTGAVIGRVLRDGWGQKNSAV
ncbi:MAG: hypothetical protein H0W68_05085 [Gemmatimonadaceae bacterium]|nr:hypothetical protein [Gemmatimonadaceae bacterium]